LQKSGHSSAYILGLWGAVVVASALVAALFGYLFLAGASGETVAVIQSFAAGAILTILASQILEQLHDLDNARRERLLAAEEGLPPILWVVLILGGVITVGFIYLFGLENTLVHTLMVAAFAMIISLTLFTVAALDDPFKGDVRIHPVAFEQVLERFHESKLSDLRR
jgi:hypothetical protein